MKLRKMCAPVGQNSDCRAREYWVYRPGKLGRLHKPLNSDPCLVSQRVRIREKESELTFIDSLSAHSAGREGLCGVALIVPTQILKFLMMLLSIKFSMKEL